MTFIQGVAEKETPGIIETVTSMDTLASDLEIKTGRGPECLLGYDEGPGNSILDRLDCGIAIPSKIPDTVIEGGRRRYFHGGGIRERASITQHGSIAVIGSANGSSAESLGELLPLLPGILILAAGDEDEHCHNKQSRQEL